MTNKTPSSILIIGSGAFGLSTAYSLATNPKYKNTTITVLDRQSFPSPDSSSVHTSTTASPQGAPAAKQQLRTRQT